MRPLRRQRRLSRGQALVELAIVFPLLLTLLLGSLQFGTLAYGSVTIDTAAREGARVASLVPVSALKTFYTSSPPTYRCSSSSDPNPACQAAYNAPGQQEIGGSAFDPSKFVVVLQYMPAASVARALPAAPTDVVQVGSCAGTDIIGAVTLPGGAAAAGTIVSGAGTGVSSSPTAADSAGNYDLCVVGLPGTQVTLNYAYPASGSCGNGETYYGQTTRTLPLVGNSNVKNVNVALLACPVTTTSTTTAATTTTVTTTGTTTAATTSSGATTTTTTATSTAAGVPPFTCNADTTALAGNYVAVIVAYPVSIFVPMINQLLGDPAWSSGNGYNPGDVAAYGGASWVSVSRNSGSTPGAGSADWKLVFTGSSIRTVHAISIMRIEACAETRGN